MYTIDIGYFYRDLTWIYTERDWTVGIIYTCYGLLSTLLNRYWPKNGPESFVMVMIPITQSLNSKNLDPIDQSVMLG